MLNAGKHLVRSVKASDFGKNAFSNVVLQQVQHDVFKMPTYVFSPINFSSASEMLPCAMFSMTCSVCNSKKIAAGTVLHAVFMFSNTVLISF
jgi:hypothetical protein